MFGHVPSLPEQALGRRDHAARRSSRVLLEGTLELVVVVRPIRWNGGCFLPRET